MFLYFIETKQSCVRNPAIFCSSILSAFQRAVLYIHRSISRFIFFLQTQFVHFHLLQNIGYDNSIPYISYHFYSIIAYLRLKRTGLPPHKRQSVLQENIFTDKQYCQHIHKRRDLLCLSAGKIDNHIRNHTDGNALGYAVHQRHCQQA